MVIFTLGVLVVELGLRGEEIHLLFFAVALASARDSIPVPLSAWLNSRDTFAGGHFAYPAP